MLNAVDNYIVIATWMVCIGPPKMLNLPHFESTPQRVASNATDDLVFT